MGKDKIIQIIYWKNPKEGYLNYFFGLSQSGNLYMGADPSDTGENFINWKLIGESPQVNEEK